jgi:hypothetical protein
MAFRPTRSDYESAPVSIEPGHEIRGGSRLIERGPKTRGFGETADIQWRRFALIAVYDFRSLSGCADAKVPVREPLREQRAPTEQVRDDVTADIESLTTEAVRARLLSKWPRRRHGNKSKSARSTPESRSETPSIAARSICKCGLITSRSPDSYSDGP